ncbi:MAG TPA: methylmalonyl-CoA epimerase [Clostridia bacterium]|mgnify:CR=1 FL=1|nr:methylmalonyl-CoA epimerase [Clostridia bacterium]
MAKIDHIGVAVKDLKEALTFYRDALGLELKGIEEVPDQKVKVAMIPVGESKIELLEATSADSPVAKFIANRGEGIHHIALQVKGLEEILSRLAAAGIKLIDEKPRLGAGGNKIAFIHPKSTNGVLLELCEPEQGCD